MVENRQIPIHIKFIFVLRHLWMTPIIVATARPSRGTWPGDERKIGSNCHVKQNISHGFKFLLATENVYG